MCIQSWLTNTSKSEVQDLYCVGFVVPILEAVVFISHAQVS
jgi:hypothetical protein